MTKVLKWTLFLLIVGLIFTGTITAQEEDAAGPSTFLGSYTLWIAIIIGFAASIATLVYAYRLQGGIIGSSLNFFGAGMFLVVLGFLSVVVGWAPEETQMIVHDIVFILGYISMLMGALRLRQVG